MTISKITFDLPKAIVDAMHVYAQEQYPYIKEEERLNIFVEHLIIQAFTRFNPMLDRSSNITRLTLEHKEIEKLAKDKGTENLSNYFRRKLWQLVQIQREEKNETRG